MLCQTNSFSLFVKDFPNDTVPRGYILISPVRYLDSSIVDGAYAIIDGNLMDRHYINPSTGSVVMANSGILQIQLLDMFYTNKILIDSLKGAELQLIIGAPFQLDDFLLETNGFYFTISPDKQDLQLFKSDGTLDCILEKREVAQKKL
ncbi:hypothetical protein [Filimonas effusa]|uniref:Uncharacterized protein n=1 Tax=Filimonas effusa TaxID=2508721 RepID=A0A4Q1DC48_9BACT|nr:hypothetical protein [Filimonas effusa]RXK86518.1 hypothetical protein ESB13_06845 [Filimonas effusa]